MIFSCKISVFSILGNSTLNCYFFSEGLPEYFSEADDKAEAFAFCRERMQADVTTEAPRLKEMSRELSEHLRRFGGTGSQQIALEQEAMNHIRLAPDREQAFAEVNKGIDMALERSRGLGRG